MCSSRYLQRDVARDEALRLHRPSLCAPLRLAVAFGAQRAEVPTLLILDRRRAVGVEDVPLVEHGTRDFFHPVEIHKESYEPLAVSYER